MATNDITTQRNRIATVPVIPVPDFRLSKQGHTTFRVLAVSSRAKTWLKENYRVFDPELPVTVGQMRAMDFIGRAYWEGFVLEVRR
jgi:hypothetical protein